MTEPAKVTAALLIGNGFDPNNLQATCDWVFASQAKASDAGRIERNEIKAAEITAQLRKHCDAACGKPVAWRIPMGLIFADGRVEMDGYEIIGYGVKTTMRQHQIVEPTYETVQRNEFRLKVRFDGAASPFEDSIFFHLNSTWVDLAAHKQWLATRRAGDYVAVNGILETTMTGGGRAHKEFGTTFRLKDVVVSPP